MGDFDFSDAQSSDGLSSSGATSGTDKWNERRLRRREADLRLALAMEVLEGGYWHYDIGSAIFETSLQLANFVAGPTAKPLDLDGYVALVLPEDRHAADLSRLIAGEDDCSVAEYRVMKNLGLRWMRCRRRLVRDDDGRPTRVIGMAVDVTEQKTLRTHPAETALRDDGRTTDLKGLRLA